MEHIGIDVHKRESQICVLNPGTGEVVERRVVTSRAGLSGLLAARAPAQVLVEAGTESRWVAAHLEALGHHVTVADPGYAPMYPRRGPRQKTDQRDARALAEASVHGTYRAVHRVSAAQQAVQTSDDDLFSHLMYPAVFADFEDYWRPFTLGAGPAPGYCASLARDARERLRQKLYDSLPGAADGSIPLRTRAWALKASV